MLGNWHIGKDNQVVANPFEWRKLKTRRYLTDRTAFIECPQYPEMNAESARLIATYYLSDAVIGKCGKVVVRGRRWHYEFDTITLNSGIKKQWRGRSGMLQNPIEKQLAGAFYDVTRKLYTVPENYNVRETLKFPTMQRAA